MKIVLLCAILYSISLADGPWSELYFNNKLFQIDGEEIEPFCYKLNSILDFAMKIGVESCEQSTVSYYSPIDTTIFLVFSFEDNYLTEVYLHRIQTCGDDDIKKGKLNLSRGWVEEMNRFQKLGLLQMDSSSLSELLDSIIKKMLAVRIYNDIENIVFYDSIAEAVKGPGCSSVLVDSTEQDSTSGFVQTALAAVPLKVRPLTDKRFFVENGQGKAYDIFDLNGKRIGGGTFRSNVLHVKSLPAILKVEGMGCVLLK